MKTPAPMQARVLVTGATGFVGRHLLAALRAQGTKAAILVRDAAAWHQVDWRAEAGEVTVIQGSPMVPATWIGAPALQKVRTIIHAAALVRHTREAPEEMLALNVRGTLEMVRAAQRLHARVVFVSSSGTVGCSRSPNEQPDERASYAQAVVGRWPYYASKIQAEREARQLAEQLGVPFVIVRAPVLLGPKDHRHRSTGHVARVLERRLPFIPRGGMHFTDVRDATAAMARLSELERPQPVYHLPGSTSTLADFFAQVSQIAGVPIPTRQPPNWVVAGAAALGRVAGARRGSWLPDPVVLEMSTCFWGLRSLWSHAELGYAPRPGPETLADTVAWLRAPHPAEAVAEPARSRESA
jgi:nucleoside-diphosphate-sugar epimerase